MDFPLGRVRLYSTSLGGRFYPHRAQIDVAAARTFRGTRFDGRRGAGEEIERKKRVMSRFRALGGLNNAYTARDLIINSFAPGPLH